MKRKHQKTLELIFSHPVSANIKWRDIESLLTVLGEVRVIYRPHPRSDTDKGAVASLRQWFRDNEVTP